MNFATQIAKIGGASSSGRTCNAKTIFRLNDGQRLTPEAYVAAHRSTIPWGFGGYAYDDPALAAWTARVSDLLGSTEGLEAAYRDHLTGETLEKALRSLVRQRGRAERERRRRERAAEFEAIHFPQG